MRPRERWNNVALRRGHKGDKSGLNKSSFAALPHNQFRRFSARQMSAVGSARTSLIFRSRIICFPSFIDPRLFLEDPFFPRRSNICVFWPRAAAHYPEQRSLNELAPVISPPCSCCHRAAILTRQRVTVWELLLCLALVVESPQEEPSNSDVYLFFL